MSKLPSNDINFELDSSRPTRRDYAREYTAARPQASNLSARSNQPPTYPSTSAPSLPQPQPRSRAARTPAQCQHPQAFNQSHPQARSAARQHPVQPHPKAPRPPNQAPTGQAPQKYMPKVEYTLADFEAVLFDITDEISDRYSHARWLTDLRNTPEPWLLPMSRSQLTGWPLTAGAFPCSVSRQILPPSVIPSALLAHSGPASRLQQAQPHSRATLYGPSMADMPDIPGQAQRRPAPPQSQRQASLISISSSSDEDGGYRDQAPC